MNKHNKMNNRTDGPKTGRPKDPNSKRSQIERERAARAGARVEAEKFASAASEQTPNPFRAPDPKTGEVPPPPPAPEPEKVKVEPIPAEPVMDAETIAKIKKMQEAVEGFIKRKIPDKIDEKRFQKDMGPMPLKVRHEVGESWLMVFEHYGAQVMGWKHFPLLVCAATTYEAFTIPSTPQDQAKFEQLRDEFMKRTHQPAARPAAATQEAPARQRAAPVGGATPDAPIGEQESAQRAPEPTTTPPSAGMGGDDMATISGGPPASNGAVNVGGDDMGAVT